MIDLLIVYLLLLDDSFFSGLVSFPKKVVVVIWTLEKILSLRGLSSVIRLR